MWEELIGVELEEKQIQNLRDNRTINLWDVGGSEARIEIGFIEKPNADEMQENLLSWLEKLIYNVSMIPNINDTNYGQQSGYARIMQMQPMKYLANDKENKFKRGLDEMFELLFSVPTNISINKADEWLNIEYSFTRDMPTDLKGEAEVLNLIDGHVSDELKLSQMTWVPDPTKELEKMEGEYEQERNLMPIPREVMGDEVQ